MSPVELIQLLQAWRKHHSTGATCTKCHQTLVFEHVPYTTCCQQFYYRHIRIYPVKSIAIPTPGYTFGLPVLKRMMHQAHITANQDFLILPDPIYWQVVTTLAYEKVMKFVQGKPITNKTKMIQPPSKVDKFYKEILEAPLNYGSLHRRSCGKNTLMRQVAFGKRCTYSMRGMIVPDASLRPNEIRLPAKTIRQFHLRHQWVILNRMPSLQPGNFIALHVSSAGWEYDCFGIPLEVVQSMNADFDGDECNLYLVPNPMSQAECATLLNPESQMSCFVMQGPKLVPTQDMLVAYYLRFQDIHFLPYKHPDLKTTFRVVCDLYGSRATFHCFELMRKFYLDAFHHHSFALTFREMDTLHALAQHTTVDTFAEKLSNECLTIQVKSGAKGGFEHLHQMFGHVGDQDGYWVRNSFYTGLDPVESMYHAQVSMEALSKTRKIWQPGYSYSKVVHNLQAVHVDYGGRLVDGDIVVEDDVLNALHFTDVMSIEAFQYLFQSLF